MILAFPNTDYKGKIKNKIKIHSIVKDSKSIWKIDMKIHFWIGEPTKVNQNPYAFGEAKVADIVDIYINTKLNLVSLNGIGTYKTPEDLHRIAISEGYSGWKKMKSKYSKEFRGKLIFWKNSIWYDDDKTSFIQTFETITKAQEFMVGNPYNETEIWLQNNTDKYLSLIYEKPVIWEGYRFIKKIVLTEDSTTEEIADAMNDESLILYLTDLTNEEEYEKAEIVLKEVKRRELNTNQSIK